MLFDYAAQEPAMRYKLMSQSVIPRPIAWIITDNGQTLNAAPFSYFTPLSSNPPTIIVSVGHKSDKTPKDTLHNIRTQKKCTVCMVNDQLLNPMHFSSKELPHEQSEVESFNIATQTIIPAFPPMIEGAPVAFFCTLHQEIALGGKTVPLILEIKHQYVHDNCITDIDHLAIAFDPVARIGKRYAFVNEPVEPPTIPE